MLIEKCLLKYTRSFNDSYEDPPMKTSLGIPRFKDLDIIIFIVLPFFDRSSYVLPPQYFILPILPVVWSTSGPVYQLGVDPILKEKSKSSDLSCSRIQFFKPSSKSQFMFPGRKKNQKYRKKNDHFIENRVSLIII